MTLPAPRIIFGFIAIVCLAAMAAALYMEHAMGMEPCPLCVFQRIMVIAAGLIAVVAAIHGPGTLGIRVYSGLIGLAGAVGIAFAGRQVWLQNLPADQVPACGPSLDYLLDVFSFAEVLQMVFSGDGTCAEIHWVFLGLTIPGWTLVGFIGLIGICLLLVVTSKSQQV